MNKSLNKLMAAMLGVAFIVSAAACTAEEPEVVVNDPDPAAPEISGVITTNGGQFLPDVTVTVTGASTYTATTGADGSYTVEVAEGSYTLSASKDGFTTRIGEVEATAGDVAVWDALLTTPDAVRGAVNAAEDTFIEVSVPSLVQSSATAKMSAAIPAGSTASDDELIMIFNYDVDVVDDTFEMDLMRLATVECSLASGSDLLGNITIAIPLPAAPHAVRMDGQDVTWTYDTSAAQVKVVTNRLGTITIDCWVAVTVEDAEPQAINWEQSVYDNFYGSSAMHIENPKYTYTAGGCIDGGSVLLNSVAAVYTGVTTQKTFQKASTIDILLPMGGQIELSGEQAIENVKFVLYGSDQVTTVTRNKVIKKKTVVKRVTHNGGSN